jgi:hypothetical protein
VTPEQTAHDTRHDIVRTTARFMNDPATYEHGNRLGFDGIDFYFAGRAGVLGDVAADIVVAALVFFPEHTIRPRWERSGLIMTRRRAASEFALCAHTWAEEHVPETVDAPRLAELAGRVIASASPAGAPVFAGWRLLDTPRSPRALAIHHLNGLRELRGALHAGAVLTVGLTPHEAVAVAAPTFLALYDWPEPHPDPEPLRDRWQLADARTDRMFGRKLAVLDETERKEFVDLLALLRGDV